MSIKLIESESFNDEEASKIMKSILEAVKYMHAKDIVHRDLKPANILIENLENYSTIKISDFGLSTMVSEYSSNFFTEQCGTPMYMAPELILNKMYSKPVDIWSCGIIMFWLLSKGKHPYKANNQKELYEEIVKCEWNFTSQFTDLAKEFFCKLMSKEPVSRYTAHQALNHPWITRNFKSNIPLTFEEKHHVFVKGLEILNIFKAVFFVNSAKRMIFNEQISPKLQKKFKISRPKSLTSNIKEKDLVSIIEETKDKINEIAIFQDNNIIKTNIPEKNSRIRSLTQTKKIEINQKPINNIINQNLNSSPKKSPNSKQFSIISKKLNNSQSLAKLNDENNTKFTKEKDSESSKLKSNENEIQNNKKYKIKSKIKVESFDQNSRKVKTPNSSNNKSNESFQSQNLTPSSIIKEFTFVKAQSNSPIKKNNNIFNQTPRENKCINDIELDKESLFQLNRATNQFFSKKLKESIKNSFLIKKKDNCETKNNISFDENDLNSSKTPDGNKGSQSFNKDLDYKNSSFSRKSGNSNSKNMNIFNQNLMISFDTNHLPNINNNRGLKYNKSIDLINTKIIKK